MGFLAAIGGAPRAPPFTQEPLMTKSRSRLALVAVFTAAALIAGVMVAMAAGNTAPPRIAFVARGDGANFADALAVGSIAGQLGAPVFTTDRGFLADAARTGLVDHAPDLVIITGGPDAILPEVEAAIEAATGLAADKVIRAAGDDRYATAAVIANLFTELGYNPAFLSLDGKAVNAATADHADDADALGGLAPSAYLQTTIPSGTTVHGTIGARYLVPVAGEVAATASLPGLAPVGLDSDHVEVAGVDGSPTECPGTWQSPRAAPGYACIYPYATDQATINGGYLWGVGENNPYGFQISWQATVADSFTVLFANWAYMAP